MDSRSFAGLSEDNHLTEAYFAQLDMETKVHKACINTMGFDEPTKMYSSKSQFPPPNDTSEVEEIPLYTTDGELFECGIIEPDPEACLYEPLPFGMTGLKIPDPGIGLVHVMPSLNTMGVLLCTAPPPKSEIYNEVIEWLELEHDGYLEGFDRDNLLSYCVAIENE